MEHHASKRLRSLIPSIPGQTSNISVQVTTSTRGKKRVACDACYTLRTKCEPVENEATCRRCKRLGYHCEVSTAPRIPYDISISIPEDPAPIQVAQCTQPSNIPSFFFRCLRSVCIPHGRAVQEVKRAEECEKS